MFFVNPYFTIFNENNWFFNDESKKITYSDNSITVDKIYLHIPFRDDDEYNRKIIIYFQKFMKVFADKITISDKPIKVSYYANLNLNKKKPIVLLLKPLIYTDTWVKIPWENINHL